MPHPDLAPTSGANPIPSAEERLAAVEQKLYESALAGDPASITLYLQAHAPETYGQAGTPAAVPATTHMPADPDWFGNWLREVLAEADAASLDDN